jgi:hypothetical protein
MRKRTNVTPTQTYRDTPPGPAALISQPPSQAFLNDAFDTIRREFDALATEVVSLRKQRDELEQNCVLPYDSSPSLPHVT